MCICNVVIMVEFKRINNNYLQLVAKKGHVLNKNTYLRKIKKNRSICLMLFNSNIFFLFVMLQYWICFFLFKDIEDKSKTIINLQSFSYIFLYTNNAFEFLIFGLTCEKYRNEFKNLFRQK